MTDTTERLYQSIYDFCKVYEAENAHAAGIRSIAQHVIAAGYRLAPATESDREMARKIMADARDRMIRTGHAVSAEAGIAAALAAVRQAEREACSQIADAIAVQKIEAAGRANMAGREIVCSHRESDAQTANEITAAIRARKP